MAAMQLALTNLKDRCNALERENKLLKRQLADKKTLDNFESFVYNNSNNVNDIDKKNTNNNRKNIGYLKNKSIINFTAHDLSDNPNQKTTFTNNNNNNQPVDPNVHSIVTNICEQLNIIGLQMESLLLDYNEINNKDELLMLSDTMEEHVIPRLCKINLKRHESDHNNNNNNVKDVDDEHGDEMKRENDEEEEEEDEDTLKIPTVDIRKLHRTLRLQNQLLKNIQTYIAVCNTIAADNKSSSSSSSTSTMLPTFEGWTVLNK
ncbi:hypothetical protein HELRODRAFT_173288 [Helobdella robusta]|uniref:Uncharacterized protein n=1 Tax=Helobdella robusta TaxID=6412 RepID=T1F6N1_HELRO|nr:hypothetical protein HELRODRAFT_173288 [Helobdella robusta]ESO03584.1 hypothetical protein HELRODRAFT_173288 [Helobdella robusta]